ARKLTLPPENAPSITSQRIIDIAPNSIDVIYSRQGETLRFHGLPFARVRPLMGEEKAWLGTGRNSDILDDGTWPPLLELTSLLRANRSAAAPNWRHQL